MKSMKKETERVTELEDLGERINSGTPAEILYDLGEGEKRTELLVSYIDKETNVSQRITSPPRISLRVANGRTLMDITDSDSNTDGYRYENLTPQGATYEEQEHPPYELGNLAIDLGEGKRLGISPYFRSE